MNTNRLESLEKRLSEWKPRQPGDRVAAALFGGEAVRQSVGLAWRELFQWLVPVTGCALLVMASAPGRPSMGNTAASATNGLIAALGWADSSHSEMNNLPHTVLNMTVARQVSVEQAALPAKTNQMDRQ